VRSCPLSDVDKKSERPSVLRRVTPGFDNVKLEVEIIFFVFEGPSSGLSGALRTRLRRLPDHHLNNPELILAFSCWCGPSGVVGRDWSPERDEAGDDERDWKIPFTLSTIERLRLGR